MSPKEKADELIQSFVPFADVDVNADKEVASKWYAIKCAL